MLHIPPPCQWFPHVNNNQPTNIVVVFNTMTCNKPEDASQYMDMGATSHLASDSSILYSVSNKSPYNPVFVGNGSSIPVTHLDIPQFSLPIVPYI